MINKKFDVGLYKVRNMPLVKKGDDIGQMIYQRLHDEGFTLKSSDIIVIAHKIVSKAEGAQVKLSEIEPSDYARQLAEKTGRDPRFCQVCIDESQAILGINGRFILTRHRLGFVGTEAGIDRSNTAPIQDEIVTLLPIAPDTSARCIRSRIKELCRKEVAVIICDTFGNEHRKGGIGMAIGVAGIKPILITDGIDLYGNRKQSANCTIDEIATAASMLMGQANEGIPVVVVRGVKYSIDENTGIKDILNV